MNNLLQTRFVSYYGNFFVLLLLCGYYSVATVDDFHPVSRAAGQQLAKFVADIDPDAGVLIVTPRGAQNTVFAVV